MVTLGIETSCDETACAVVDNSEVLSSAVSSSVHLHEPYGGVVPEIASRYHTEYINFVFKSALKHAKVDVKDIGLIAVTYGPGLAGSLLTGLSFAKGLSFSLSRPLIGVNHILAHLYANFIKGQSCGIPSFPFIGLVISGGHTNIILMRGINNYQVLGRTQDDAVGEAFDKVAKVLDLGYPGGPIIEMMARKASGKPFVKFPRAFLGKGSFDFSFSGVKTAVLYHVREKKKSKELAHTVSYAFQEAVFDVVLKKVIDACKRERLYDIVVGGGVAANEYFCVRLRKEAGKNGIKAYIPPKRFCVDNAAMIACLGEKMHSEGMKSSLDLTAVPNLEL